MSWKSLAQHSLAGACLLLQDGQQQLGISFGIIMCFLRHLDAADAMATLVQALPHKDKIIGVGLDSSELGHPPEKFTEVFEKAKSEGFRIVAKKGRRSMFIKHWIYLKLIALIMVTVRWRMKH